MADNIIELEARLSDDSLSNIEQQIRNFQNRLNASVGINLNVNPVINASNISAQNIQASMQQAIATPVNIDIEANPVLRIDSNVIQRFTEDLMASAGTFHVENDFVSQLSERLGNLQVSVTSITPEFVKMANGTENLTRLTVKGVDAIGNMVNYIEYYDAKTGAFERNTVKVTETLANVRKEEKRVADEAKEATKQQEALQRVQTKFVKAQADLELYSRRLGDDDGLRRQYEDISRLIATFDNTQPLENQRTEITRIQGALRVLKDDIDRVRDAAQEASSQDTEQFTGLSSYRNILAYSAKGDKFSTDDLLSIARKNIQSEIGDAGEVTRVSKATEDATGNLTRFLVQVERADKSMETLTYAINQQGNAYEYLGKTVREADNSTAFRDVDVKTQWENQANKLTKFIADAERAGFASTELKKEIEELNEGIAKKGDTNALKDYLDKSDLAHSKLQALNAEARRDNALETHNNRIQKLSASLNDYAAKNTKATQSNKTMSDGVTTFAEKWAELNRRLQQSDLSADEFKHLNEEVATFKKEADAAGLSSSSLFRDMRTQLAAVIAQWISLQGAIRIVRSLVDEVKTLDTAMVELRKVTEATDEQFSAFQKSAANTAKTYGASISDVIDATSEFSRAGFGLVDAEELGRVATLYKNVGDGITIGAASESIISIMKAFNIEAENSEQIIDKINKVSNNFSITSGGLGESLQRVASAMFAANNTLDETISLTTVANEIVQDPVSVAQGWRTVALRIRGAKADLESMGEDTEGMVESTSKLQTLIKSLSGVDIMLDDTTFKSTYQIVKELGAVWNDINDINQATILEAIAGRFCLSVQKCIRSLYLIAGNALEPYTTITETITL